MEQALHSKAIRRDNPVVHRILKAVVYILLLAMAFFGTTRWPIGS